MIWRNESPNPIEAQSAIPFCASKVQVWYLSSGCMSALSASLSIVGILSSPLKATHYPNKKSGAMFSPNFLPFLKLNIFHLPLLSFFYGKIKYKPTSSLQTSHFPRFCCREVAYPAMPTLEPRHTASGAPGHISWRTLAHVP